MIIYPYKEHLTIFRTQVVTGTSINALSTRTSVGASHIITYKLFFSFNMYMFILTLSKYQVYEIINVVDNIAL